jgi:hypothetical protein
MVARFGARAERTMGDTPDQDGKGLEAILPKGFENALDAQRDAEAVEKLKAACLAAYDKHKGSCSHAVNAVIREMLGLDETGWPHRQANALIAFLDGSAEWTVVELDRGYELAQHGVPVIGGKAETGTNGHVVVIYPGAKKPRGGYTFSKDGGLKTVASKGLYPLAMSTSIGSWPGALSKGDKTVWDPWGNDAAFAQVRFWAPARAAAGKADVSAALKGAGGPA